MSIIKCASDTITTNWKPIVVDILKQIDTSGINEILVENNYLPCYNNIFECFNYSSVEDLNVVIMGQDPYPGKQYANGLAFSTGNGKIPPSLRNIFKELNYEFDSLRNIFKELNYEFGTLRINSDLTDWAKQGVLLLNTVLTTETGKRDAHKKIGWEIFTSKLINYISLNMSHVCFMLWGNKSQKLAKYINNESYIIQCSHPSPLSFYKSNVPMWQSYCFTECSDYLRDNGIGYIKWLHLDK
jgi:uracil-DNA glycosylase